MARRRQRTTGLPKDRRPTRPAPTAEAAEGAEKQGSLREYKSRAEREVEIQRYVILATAGAIALIVLVILVAIVIDQVIQPNQTVASVNGDRITVREFQQRVRFERLINIERISSGINDNMEAFDLPFEDAANQTIGIEPYNTLWTELNIPDQIGLRVLNDMINDELIRKEAASREITASQEEIDAEIEEVFSFDRDVVNQLLAEETPEPTVEPTSTPTPFVSPTPSPEPTATNTPEVEPTITSTPFPTVEPPPTRTADERIDIYEEARDDFYSLARREAGFGRDQVNEYFEVQVLREKLAAQVVGADTSTETWVNSRHILVETEEEALDIIDALKKGESFAALALAKGTDGTSTRGGELGWSPLSGYVEDFADAIRDAPVSEILGPVQTEFGYHVVQIRAREERDAEGVEIDLTQDEAFTTFVEELRTQEGNSYNTSDIWPDYVPDDPPWSFRPRE